MTWEWSLWETLSVMALTLRDNYRPDIQSCHRTQNIDFL